MLTPARRRGVEILDDPSHDPALAVRSLHDVAKANRWFGGRHAVQRAIDRASLRQSSPIRWLDIGTGLGDIPHAVSGRNSLQHRPVQVIGLELDLAIARVARRACHHVVTASAMQLPFADRSIDIVTCSQVLHHFDGEAAHALLRECSRVSRQVVIVSDLRRSWLAVAGLWAASYLLRFHPVSRHDGVVSILRGYTAGDLSALIEAATGTRPTVAAQPGWRITATWHPHPHAT